MSLEWLDKLSLRNVISLSSYRYPLLQFDDIEKKRKNNFKEKHNNNCRWIFF